MSRRIAICIYMFITSIAILGNQYFDTGFITWSQPDSTEFEARYWGDGFYWWMETNTGYSIILGDDGYYYYAQLDSRGEYEPSSSKVGIDTPVSASLGLVRSSQRISFVDAQIDSFEASLDDAWQDYLTKKAASPNGEVTYRLGVILVDFTPSKRWKSPDNEFFPDGYHKSHYDSLLFSDDYWYDNAAFSSPHIHPDQHQLFGSLKNYYHDQSFNTFHIEGLNGESSIANPANSHQDSSDLPVWVVLDTTKLYYSTRFIEFFDDATEAADTQLTADLTQFDFLVFIVAGKFQGNLAGIANPSNGRYLNTEVSLYTDPRFFSHIGAHGHELGHLLGLPHYNYLGGGPQYNPNFNIMSYASNGPSYDYTNFLGACPSGFCPYARVHKLQFASYDTIKVDTTLTLHYDNDAPKYYLFPVDETGDEYVVENRLREGYDLWAPNDPFFNYGVSQSIDPNGNLGGMLIWRHRDGIIDFLAADGKPASGIAPADTNQANMAGDPWPFDQQDANGSGLNFNDFTSPGTMDENVASKFAINDIQWNTSDSSVTIDIEFNYPIQFISEDTTWSGAIDLPYHVIVDSGATLTLAPGTTVTFDTLPGIHTAELRISKHATLIASGTDAQPVVLKSIGTEKGSWAGIILEESSSFSLEHCQISDGDIGIDVKNASNVQLKNISINNCNTGIIYRGNNTEIDSCSFFNTTTNLNIPGDSSSTISNCIFSGGVVRDGIDTGLLVPSISRCSFDGGASLRLYSNASVTRSVFHDATVELFGSATVKNNVLSDSLSDDYGIWVFTDRIAPLTPVIENNTISSYRIGIYILEDINNQGYFVAEPDIRNNILFQNTLTANDSATLGGNGTVAFNNIFNVDTTGAGIGTNGNISSDPKFVDVASQDFHLKSTSPSIDTGDSLSSYANEPSPNGGRINMGAYGNTAEATLTFDQIVEANLTADTTWSGYVNILNDISTNGNALTVLKNTRVLFDDGVTLTIDSDLRAGPITGVPSGSDSTVFSGYREKDTMGGLLVMAGSVDTLFMRYTHFNKANSAVTIQGELGGTTAMDSSLLEFLTFEDNTTGLYLSRVEVRVDSSTFRNNKDGIIASQSDLDLFGSLLEDNNRRGLYLNHSEMKIKGNTFDDNGINGVMFKYSSTGSFRDNTITGNGGSPKPGSQDVPAGLLFYQSSPKIVENDISKNEAAGIVSMSSSAPVLNSPPLGGGFNYIFDNGASPLDAPEISIQDLAFPVLDLGHNDIADNDPSWLVYSDSSSGSPGNVKIRGNYWAETDSATLAGRLFPSTLYDFTPFDTSPNTSGSFNKGTSTANYEVDSLFLDAFTAETDADFTSAISQYDSLISTYPDDILATASLERLYVCKLGSGESISDIISYFENYLDSPNQNHVRTARRIYARLHTLDSEYSTAISEHEDWLIDADFISDSIYSEIDILTNEILASGGYLGKSNGSSGQGKQQTSLAQIRTQQSSFDEYITASDKLLGQLFMEGSDHQLVQVPKKYALFQNYPNPFNPTTTIRYELPFDSKVKIEIFNILGQRVRTLVDQRDQAGIYEVLWDGRSQAGSRVASGLYIYRIQAESSTTQYFKAKKMILIR